MNQSQSNFYFLFFSHTIKSWLQKVSQANPKAKDVIIIGNF